MGELIINEQDQTVQIRGIKFPVDQIRAAMIETGGIVVANKELNDALDRALYNHVRVKDKAPTMLIIESEPGMVFIPKKVTVFHRPFQPAQDGIDGLYLYFAARKKYHA